MDSRNGFGIILILIMNLDHCAALLYRKNFVIRKNPSVQLLDNIGINYANNLA